MQQKIHTVTIEVLGDKLKIDKPKLVAGNGDEIEWNCADPWALVFEPPQGTGPGKPFKDGPFKDRKRVRKKGTGQPNRGTVEKHEGTDQVRYKYTVACYKGGEVYIEDPEVIVDPTS